MQTLRILSILCFFALPLLSMNETKAQVVVSACQSWTPVASGCVGACANPSFISFTNSPCTSIVSNFCLTTDASSLCTSHDAYARVFVNGNVVAGGNITTVGSAISFSALCGDNISVIAVASPNGSGISCVWLGDLNYSLRRQ